MKLKKKYKDDEMLIVHKPKPVEKTERKNTFSPQFDLKGKTPQQMAERLLHMDAEHRQLHIEFIQQVLGIHTANEVMELLKLSEVAPDNPSNSGPVPGETV